MKSRICFLMLVVLFFGCSTKEEKIENLIKDYVFKNLYDISSYEPIETKIDSAYYNVYIDSTTLHYAYLLNENIKKVHEYVEKGNRLQKELDFELSWINISPSSKKKAEALLIDIRANVDSVKKYNPRLKEFQELIKERSTKLPTKEFIGWLAQHKFRCKTKGGNYDIGNYIFVVDKDIEKIMYQFDNDDNELAEIAKLIDESLKME